LSMLLSVPWLSFEPVGSIHLVEGTPAKLSLKAQCNLPEQLRKSCASISFGQCLCGKAAQTQEILFSDCVDERHDISYDGMEPHGHYIVPIVVGNRTLGVIDIYLKEGHIRNRREEDFLITIADTLAGIITRRQAEAEKERLQAQLLQAQKMEAVGHLAGGIAHDFNNILTAIMGFGYILGMKMGKDDPLRLYPQRILSAAERAIQLTQSLLAFSRKQITHPRPVKINLIITEAHKIFHRIIGEDIEVRLVPSNEDIMVKVDANQMEQVLINLATNARDAMPEGGALTIKTRAVDLAEDFIRTHGFGTLQKYALISVSDTGTGMNKDMIEKIFEPFYTTKDIGKGTGLGLAIVYGIIKQHEGFIDVHSEPGKGATFEIYLPATNLLEDEEDRSEAVAAPERGSETILVAEDNAEVRSFVKEILEDSGYTVIEAADGTGAIETFLKHRDEIQLLLLDVIMPKKNGKEAYEEIKSLAPYIKTLFLSGYPSDFVHKKGILEKEHELLLKPVSSHLLLKKVREILDR
ncbi:MAG TPA: ATP-binding protein, partial [Thermodesulfovibrionales bacterium]|nr:ATP-binding protein [Thermodesulfovibrionales bacterium]